ncbi:hypothetical protein [Aquabacterium sp.]|uniref:hypothetical protein n=1 Tax=Aquabacterium sp. TaxID=1872578 RepID=UPI002E37965D|nr:hypothetical protein [Aquabacterium sp.]HEX5311229.1 hypothetical protein [Aquabacterium sp.]
MNDATGGLSEFLDALFESEGGGNAHIVNQYGYLGKYQFGEDALVDLGYYKADGSKNVGANGKFKYDWAGAWTGKHGATSKEVFLSSPEIQDHAARDWVALLCKRMHRYKLDGYIGKTVGGVEVTESGLIAAAHLKGFGNAKHPGVIAFLKSGGTINAADANGTKVSSYMKRFAGYNLGCCAKCAVQVVDKDKNPIAGLGIKLLAKGKEVYRGVTDAFGSSPFVGGFSAGHELTVLVERIEGGFKEIVRFTAAHTPMTVALVSPRTLLELPLQPHAGAAGSHKKATVKDKRNDQLAGKPNSRPSGSHRNSQGNPVQIAQPPKPLPPIEDRLKALQDILLRNAGYGKKSVPLNGPAAVIKSRNGEAITEYRKGRTTSIGRCYKYVKIALQASGLVSCYLAGEHAKDAGPELARQGYENLLDGPHNGIEGPMDAPVGAVIVYRPTDGSPDGHIEVRIDDEGTPAVASDFISRTPRTERPNGPKQMEGRHRKVIGIWVKRL